MYRETTILKRPDTNTLWPWYGITTNTEHDAARKSSPGFLDWSNVIVDSLTHTTITNWVDEQSCTNFKNSQIHQDWVIKFMNNLNLSGTTLTYNAEIVA